MQKSTEWIIIGFFELFISLFAYLTTSIMDISPLIPIICATGLISLLIGIFGKMDYPILLYWVMNTITIIFMLLLSYIQLFAQLQKGNMSIYLILAGIFPVMTIWVVYEFTINRKDPGRTL